MRESYCIACGEKKDGIEIKEDHVIQALRWFNRTVMKQNRNNRIVVCSACYDKYSKQRKRYISRQRIYAVLGILFLLFGVLIARSIQSVLIGLGVIALLYLISLLSYMPDLNYRKGEKKGKDSS